MPAVDVPISEVQPVGLCLECNYALVGDVSEHRCPECGRDFDPNDLSTVNLGKPLSPAARWVLGPVSWKATAIALAAGAFTIWHARLPRIGRVSEPRMMLIVWTFVAIIWLGWPVLRMLVARRNGWRLSIITAGKRARWWVGILAALLVIALANQWPIKLSFAISRSKMESIARPMMDDRRINPRDQWVGPYKMTAIKRVPAGVRFVARRGDGYEAGFIYLPDADSTKNWSSYRSIGDGWWTWYEEVP